MTYAAADLLGIAERLRANARAFPDKKAIIYPAGRGDDGQTVYQHKTFQDVDAESDAYAAGFHRAGITTGTKTVLMLKPGPELFAVVFGLFKLGAVPVVVDPGMGVRRMLHCYREVGAEAFIGLPIAHVVRVLNPRAFARLRTLITAGRRWFWGGHSLAQLAVPGTRPPEVSLSGDDLLMIGFTTGSTGPAKGVESTHGALEAMTRQVQSAHGQSPDDVSLITLPLIGIFDLLLGSTCVLPPLDPTKVASADPRIVVDAITRFGVTSMFASPALLHRFGRYAADVGLRLPTLRRVVSGGAPVTDSIVASMHELLSGRDDARFYTTYGATEALPISSIDSAEILGETRARTRAGAGTCVGRPVDDMDVRIVSVTDAPLPQWSAELAVALGEIGEIALAGPTVSRRYHASDAANASMKIADGDRVWHRTGDLGYVDPAGRIWFCGRKSHRVHTADGPMDTVQCEGVFNAHPEVYRTALVGVGERDRQQPVLCVELRKGVPDSERPRIEAELRELAGQHPRTSGIGTYLFHPAFPVDIRHNAKINREELATWASAQRGSAAEPSSRPASAKALWLVPIGGWLFLLYGLVFPFEHVLLWTLFWIDAFLSIVVHGLQVPHALSRGRRAGHGTAKTVFLTMLLGATWWKTLTAAPRGAALGEATNEPIGRRR